MKIRTKSSPRMMSLALALATVAGASVARADGVPKEEYEDADETAQEANTPSAKSDAAKDAYYDAIIAKAKAESKALALEKENNALRDQIHARDTTPAPAVPPAPPAPPAVPSPAYVYQQPTIIVPQVFYTGRRYVGNGWNCDTYSNGALDRCAPAFNSVVINPRVYGGYGYGYGRSYGGGFVPQFHGGQVHGGGRGGHGRGGWRR